ncbi:imidazolonepropionase [Motilimonas sp. KMU-193]|uniref:imidazolonepropionase n=1 Tax=Motilimonas sp. KMU-193 TaxID=3388668 RepID=UPI00396B33A7
MNITFAQCSTIWINAELISFDPNVPTSFGTQRSCAVGVADGFICCIAPMSEFDASELTQQTVIDLQGRWLSPGLIDCHTHLVFAGDRSDDYELMQRGVPYLDLLAQGGGIYSTVRETRQASMRQLLDIALPKVKKLIKEGVTRIEIKSGYGLDLETETKMLKVAKAIEKALPISVSTTFMGAHVFPVEYQGKEDAYLALLCQQMIPALAEQNLIDAVDIFCDPNAFSLSMAKPIFEVAKFHKLLIRAHSEQFRLLHSASLAASHHAKAVAHLNYLDEHGVKALATYDCNAILLPLSHYYLQIKHLPPIDLMREYKINLAIASDYNAGSSPLLSLLLAANMACIHFGLSAEEAFKGITLNAARALGVEKLEGSLEVGKVANMVAWDVRSPRDVCLQYGLNPVYQRIYQGKVT